MGVPTGALTPAGGFGPHRLIDEAEELLAAAARAAEQGSAAAVIAAARDQAGALAPAAGGNLEAARLGALVFAADVIAGLAPEHEWSAREIDALTARLAEILELPLEVTALGVYQRVIRDPRLLELPPWLAIETMLRLLFAFAPIGAVSLWKTGPLEASRCVCSAGGSGPTRRMRAAAVAAAQGAEGVRESRRARVHAVPVLRWEHVCAVLVLRAEPKDRNRALAFARESVGTLGLLLERDALLEQGVERERSLVESSERRLTRLGFDLHDGPLQDVGAATRELRLFREQLARTLPPGEDYEPVLGRLDELEEILLASEVELRELAQLTGSPTILERPLREIIAAEVDAFASSTGVRALVDLRGDLEPLTASQKIALIRILQEALTNVREHSGATQVLISVVQTRERVYAEVVDNGCGFDVERTLVQAARRGRLGLVGMSERVRLLGGTLDVRSRPGDSTVVCVTLPQWRPALIEQTGGALA